MNDFKNTYISIKGAREHNLDNISVEKKVIEQSIDSQIDFDAIDNANAYYSERYGWTQGEFTNIENLAALRSDGTVICWGHHPYLPDENNGGVVINSISWLTINLQTLLNDQKLCQLLSIGPSQKFGSP